MRCSDALYGGTADQFASLSSAELECLFDNTTTCELLLDSDTTLFDVVMKANCFRDESNFVLSASSTFMLGIGKLLHSFQSGFLRGSSGLNAL